MLEYILAFLTLYTAVFYLLLYISREERLGKDPEPKSFPTVSVIIPAYNEEGTIRETAESVLSLDYPKGKLEVIVVNDGSKDRTIEVARAIKGVRVIDKKNTGKANSINVAIKGARGEIIAILDADSYVSSKALLCMIGYFEDEEVASVTAMMKVWEPKTLVQRLQRGEYLLNAFFKKLQSFVDGISVTPGPFSIYRKSVLISLGGFDEHTLTEDQEIAMRIQAANLRIENSINAEVFTKVPERLRPLFRQRRRWYLGYLQNIWKHRSLLHPRYGDFGLFILPTAFAILILTVLSVFLNYAPRSLDFSFRIQPIFPSILYLELTPVRLMFLAALFLNAIAVYYTLRNTKESGFLGSFLSLIVISTLMLALWMAVLSEQVVNTARGLRPEWRGD